MAKKASAKQISARNKLKRCAQAWNKSGKKGKYKDFVKRWFKDNK
jgi:hypothetical protein